MGNIEVKIKKAQDQISKKFKDNRFNFLYSFTTENINGYLDFFELKGKSLLTVGSSSDQVLNAFYCGCEDITLIDINEYTEEYFYLKKTAIEELDYDSFFKFLSMEGNIYINFKSFNRKTFEKVVGKIEHEDSKLFWEEILNNNKIKDIKRSLFTPDVPVKYALKKLNRYLATEDNYNNLKGRIKNLKPKFITANIYNYELKRNYDNIFLSNIADYYDVNETHKMYERLKNNLNDNGKLMIAYLYGPNYYLKDRKIYEFEKTREIFKDAELKSFKGSEDIDLRIEHDYLPDDILVYTKK